MSTTQEIYKGFWVNHAKGSITGSTVTLSTNGGGYLIAFLARKSWGLNTTRTTDGGIERAVLIKHCPVFVHIAGASFWRLLCYLIFRLRSKPPANSEQDDVKNQQQAVLRNSTSSMSAVRGFTKIIIRSKNVPRNISLLGLACVNFAGFIMAGIFSSKVTAATSDVLLVPTHCGRWVACVRISNL